jgi:predicted nucleotidyltransferase
MTIETDKVIVFIKAKSAKHTGVKRALLYGSRSKGTFHDKSDYDVAFVWENRDDKDWVKFVDELRSENPTLYSLDIVRMDRIGEELKERILSEGTVIYE